MTPPESKMRFEREQIRTRFIHVAGIRHSK
jgi:hypothetical protein